MSKRSPTQEEKNFWQRATQDITPLTHDKIPLTFSKQLKKNIKSKHREAENIFGIDSNLNICVQPAPLSRRKKRAVMIEAKLDLHGLNTRDAQQKVNEFIMRAYQKKKRCILIITGKGEKILHQYVCEMLKASSTWVSNFSTARPNQGGPWAYYVFLKTLN